MPVAYLMVGILGRLEICVWNLELIEIKFEISNKELFFAFSLSYASIGTISYEVEVRFLKISFSSSLFFLELLVWRWEIADLCVSRWIFSLKSKYSLFLSVCFYNIFYKTVPTLQQGLMSVKYPERKNAATMNLLQKFMWKYLRFIFKYE